MPVMISLASVLVQTMSRLLQRLVSVEVPELAREWSTCWYLYEHNRKTLPLLRQK